MKGGIKSCLVARSNPIITCVEPLPWGPGFSVILLPNFTVVNMNTLDYGDNLHIADEAVDLIYLNPPSSS